MELVLKRTTKTDVSTIGELFIDGNYECFILEDVDRELSQLMDIEDIKENKVYGQTAIPIGKYEIAITYSNRFKQYLPLLMSVPGYEGIRIHPGNTATDSLGCLLPGEFRNHNQVTNSRKAFKKLFDKLKAVEKKEKITITIE